MMEKEVVCSLCGTVMEAGCLIHFDGEEICGRCLEQRTAICDRCGERIWTDDAYGDSNWSVCQHCYDAYYYSCDSCGCLVHQDDVYYLGEGDARTFCYTCYCSNTHNIHDYSYKPAPVFFGSCERYMGVELEIDEGGETDKNANALLAIANRKDDLMYCKHDGSLNDGMELVTHPMSLCYHLNNMPWGEVLDKAKSLKYISHQAGTCGLHIHVNREAFGKTPEEQEACIARVLYFFEKHWEELLKFSRRTQRQLERWAARYGLKDKPKDILHAAKGDHRYNRYTCVNLTNPETIEFRMFRGTLKLNTLIATLQLIDRICDVAVHFTDEEITAMSWTTFVSGCTQPELVQYLKERRLYINDPIAVEEEV